MASNSFGTVFRITTWGESHGKAIGVVIDGCPAGLEICEDEIRLELAARRPGNTPWTSPRVEMDEAEILSGVFDGKTTGTPISILIWNQDMRKGAYEGIKDILRPGHANFTYLAKYGIFDPYGGGRASARETACRVAAGAVAKKLLSHHGILVSAYLKQVGECAISSARSDPKKSPIFCPCPTTEKAMIALLEEVKSQGNSLGGVVEFVASGLPVGLGDPIYSKLEANLALALLSIPASRSFEIGEGTLSATMLGSDHNDQFQVQDGKIVTRTNHAGGVLGGISTSMPLIGRVAFKPTSSIQKEQKTLSTNGKEVILEKNPQARHDPCVAIRAAPVVEAMVALVLADALLMNRLSRI